MISFDETYMSNPPFLLHLEVSELETSSSIGGGIKPELKTSSSISLSGLLLLKVRECRFLHQSFSYGAISPFLIFLFVVS